MRQPIEIRIVPEKKDDSRWGTIVSFIRHINGLIKDLAVIVTLLVAVLYQFEKGKIFLASITSFSEPWAPDTNEVPVVVTGSKTQITMKALSPTGWSYLGNVSNPEDWYFPILESTTYNQAAWVGEIVKPSTSIYLRTEPISAENPNPQALAVIGNSTDQEECLYILGSKNNERTGSIWLQGFLTTC